LLSILSGKFKGQKLEVPTSGTRPTSALAKKALFDSIRPDIQAAIFCDLFAGSGAVGLEALSQGAELSYFVESSPRALACLKKNIAKLKCQEMSRVWLTPAARFLKAEASILASIDFFYIDPPYDIKPEDPSSYESLLTLLDTTYLKKSVKIILETDDLSRLEKSLKTTSSLSPLQVKNYGDCHLIYVALK